MIIGFTGKMGVGKSTAVKELGDKFKLIKFAQPLYDIQEYAYRRIEGAYKRPENFIKDRTLLQWLGTEWGRNTLSQNLWIDVWKTDAEIALFKGNYVVVDDVRFDNEAQAIRELGGKIIQITSDRTEERIDTKAGISGHPSESGVTPNLVDITVKNDLSLTHYLKELEAVFNSLGIK